jgi:hypothetical protein
MLRRPGHGVAERHESTRLRPGLALRRRRGKGVESFGQRTQPGWRVMGCEGPA